MVVLFCPSFRSVFFTQSLQSVRSQPLSERRSLHVDPSHSRVRMLLSEEFHRDALWAQYAQIFPIILQTSLIIFLCVTKNLYTAVSKWCMIHLQQQTGGLKSFNALASPLFSNFNLFFPPCFMSAFQKSAMKPHTYTIMKPESLGAEYTSGTWNSACVRPGKSSAKEPATQVRFSASSTWTNMKIKFHLNP